MKVAANDYRASNSFEIKCGLVHDKFIIYSNHIVLPDLPYHESSFFSFIPPQNLMTLFNEEFKGQTFKDSVVVLTITDKKVPAWETDYNYKICYKEFKLRIPINRFIRKTILNGDSLCYDGCKVVEEQLPYICSI